MKRKIVTLLMITMTMNLLVSCGKKEDVAQQKVEAAQAATESEQQEVAEETEEEIQYATTSVGYTGECKNFTGSIECIEIIDENYPELAKSVNNEFSKLVKDFNKTADQLVKDAEEQNAEQADEFGEVDYYYVNSASVVRADSKVFSIVINYEMYSGGAHGSHAVEGLVFDSKTGKLLSWKDFKDVAPQVKDYVFDIINESGAKGQDLLFEDYEETINKDFDKQLDTIAMWLDGRGLSVAFGEYEIAPYASGTVTFTVPYSALDGFDKKYIPNEGNYYLDIYENYFIDKVDLDGDGQLDNICLDGEYDEETGKSQYTLNYKDETLEVLSDKNDKFSNVRVFFLHQQDGNYIVVSYYGVDDARLTKVYSYDGKLKEIDSADKYVRDVKTEGSEIVFVMSEPVEVFGTWECLTDYHIEASGCWYFDRFKDLDNDPLKNPFARGLKLKQAVSFDDESGEEPKKAKVGEVIYPTVLHGDETAVGFETKNGEYLGYLIYTEDEKGVKYVNDISEKDLFEEVSYDEE